MQDRARKNDILSVLKGSSVDENAIPREITLTHDGETGPLPKEQNGAYIASTSTPKGRLKFFITLKSYTCKWKLGFIWRNEERWN